MNTNTPSPFAALLAGMLADAAAQAQAKCRCPRCTAIRARAESKAMEERDAKAAAEDALRAMDTRDAKAAAESAAADYTSPAVSPEYQPTTALTFAHELVAVLVRQGITEARLYAEHNGKEYTINVYPAEQVANGSFSGTR